MVFFLQILFLIAPVVLAGLAHVVVLKLNIWPSLLAPLDFGGKVNGQRLFGDNKTLRGLLVMMLVAAVVMALQAWLYRVSDSVRQLSFFDYSAINPWIAGAIFGAGYSLGELPNSFVKRQLRIPPGQQPQLPKLRALWYFIDQTDSVIGALITMRYFFPASFTISLVCFIVGTAIHILVDQVLYMLKIKS